MKQAAVPTRRVVGTARGVLLLACLLTLALAAGVGADQGVSFRADVEAKRIGVDDQVQLTITIEGRSIQLTGDLEMPALENLRLVGGPSQSNQFSWVNGAMSQSRVWVLVLQAAQVGPARIGPVRAPLADGVRSTAAIDIEVVAGSVLQRRQRGHDPFDAFGGADPLDSFMAGRRRPRAEPKLFMEASVDRNAVYVGEAMLLTYYLYTQVSVTGLDLAQPPKYAGFWVEELERPDTAPEGEMVERDGESYRRFAVLRRLLFPTKAGSLEIPGTSFKVAVPRGGGFFDPLPAGSAVVMRASRAIPVTVKALPVAEDYFGAVGRLKATASIDRSALAVGEAITLRFRVEGTGNLKWLDQAPALQVAGARVYPPQVKPELKLTPHGFTGSKTWEFVVIPETAGPRQVPALSFACLDPESGQIKRTLTPPLSFYVAAAATTPGVPVLPGQATAPVSASGAPMLRLRADLEPSSQVLRGVGPGALSVTAGVVLLGHGILLALAFVPRLRSRAGTERGPGVSARHALAQIARARKQKASKEGAALAIERALCDLFGELDERSGDGDSEQERELKEILREVRFIRFAPQLGDYSEKLDEVAARAAAAVRRFA